MASPDIQRRVDHARSIHNELGPWLRRYHGGCPVGFLAAIIQWESGGKMSSRGDESLGEVGYFQITRSFPPKVGVPADRRFDAETNIFLGCLEYQMMAVEMHLAGASLGGSDSWKLARLAFAIGAGGTRKLMKAAGPSFFEVLKWVERGGGMSLGRQSAEKIRFRVQAIETQWQVGMHVKPPFPSAPVSIPAPAGISYRLPEETAALMPSPWRGDMLAIALSALAFAV